MGLASKEFISVVTLVVSSVTGYRDGFCYEILRGCAGCWFARPPGCPLMQEMRLVKNSGATATGDCMTDSHLPT